MNQIAKKLLLCVGILSVADAALTTAARKKKQRKMKRRRK